MRQKTELIPDPTFPPQASVWLSLHTVKLNKRRSFRRFQRAFFRKRRAKPTEQRVYPAAPPPPPPFAAAAAAAAASENKIESAAADTPAVLRRDFSSISYFKSMTDYSEIPSTDSSLSVSSFLLCANNDGVEDLKVEECEDVSSVHVR